MCPPHRSPVSEQPIAPSPTVYDWNRFGRHRLRAVAAVLLDHPLTTVGWVATAWADPSQPAGWNRTGWSPAPTGGWALRSRLALGDVIEFGAGAGAGAGADRWVGIVDSYDPAGWLTLQGPYSSLAGAAADAERLLAAERYLPALEPQPRRRTTPPCTRRRQRPGRHP